MTKTKTTPLPKPTKAAQVAFQALNDRFHARLEHYKSPDWKRILGHGLK